MSIFEVDAEAARKTLEKVKAFCSEVAKKKQVYTVYKKGICCTTMKWWADEYANGPKDETKADVVPACVDLEKVERLFRDGVPIVEIAKAVELSVYALRKVCQQNDVNISKKAQIEERNEQIRTLAAQGKTALEIKELLKLDLVEKTIKDIIR